MIISDLDADYGGVSSARKLMIINSDLGGGGVERIISLLSLHAPPNWSILLVLWNKVIKYPLKRGTRIYFIHPYRKPFDFFKSLIDLCTILLKEKPDIIMAAKGKALTLMLFLMGVKRVVRVPILPIGGHSGLVNNLLYRFKMKLLYGKAYKVIAISSGLKNFLVSELGVDPDKIEVILNPCNIRLISKLSNEPLNDEEERIFKHTVLLSVGRLAYEKGQWHLIRSFKLVSEKDPSARLVIIGEGPLRGYLEKLIMDLGLSGKVHLLGWKPNPFKYMARSFLFCFPSLLEGLENVIIEALACGLPVMSSDCLSGPREILAPGTEYKVGRLREAEYGEYGILMTVMDGRLYSASDPLTWREKVWADEIVRLLRNPEILEEYKKKGPQRAADFDIPKIIPKYFSVFDE